MKQYIMYTYNLMLNEEPDLFEDVQQAKLSEAQSILGAVLQNELKLSYSKSATEEVPLDVHLEKDADGIFLLMLQKAKDVKYMEGFTPHVLESHPACYVIIDNRDDVCQLAIEKNADFNLSHGKVAEAITRGLNAKLKTHGLRVGAALQKDPEDFWRTVDKCVVAGNDPIRSIRLDFLDPKRACVNGGNKELLRRMVRRDFMSIFAKSVKMRMYFEGEEDMPLVNKEDKAALRHLTEIATLCSMNNFDISLKFQSNKEISLRGPEYLSCMIDERDIEDFKEGKTTTGGGGQKTSLEIDLDNFRAAHNFR